MHTRMRRRVDTLIQVMLCFVSVASDYGVALLFISTVLDMLC
jgi:hypothetical protein